MINTGHPEGIEIGVFIKGSTGYFLVDTRESAKYAKGHVAGAANIPFGVKCNFGKIVSGVEGKEFIVTLKKYNEENKPVLFYCSTGKIHSRAFASLAGQHAIESYFLIGGYKTYREYLTGAFFKPCDLIVLAGETGSSKTAFLREVQAHGEQVVDLEGLACHRGSAFGGLHHTPQPSHEQFQNDLFSLWITLDFDKRIWIEDEVRHIGRVGLPDGLWHNMQQGKMIRLVVPLQVRVNNIVMGYGCFPAGELEAAIYKIQLRLGKGTVELAVKNLRQGDLHKTTEILLEYYDKAYRKRLSGIGSVRTKEVFVTGGRAQDTVMEIIRAANEFLM